jgi:hypothetical protein
MSHKDLTSLLMLVSNLPYEVSRIISQQYNPKNVTSRLSPDEMKNLIRVTSIPITPIMHYDEVYCYEKILDDSWKIHYNQGVCLPETNNEVKACMILIKKPKDLTYYRSYIRIRNYFIMK